MTGFNINAISDLRLIKYQFPPTDVSCSYNEITVMNFVQQKQMLVVLRYKESSGI